MGRPHRTARSVDTAHAVDGDLFDQYVLDERVLDRFGRIIGHVGSWFQRHVLNI
jgi:hypothetical protein